MTTSGAMGSSRTSKKFQFVADINATMTMESLMAKSCNDTHIAYMEKEWYLWACLLARMLPEQSLVGSRSYLRHLRWR